MDRTANIIANFANQLRKGAGQQLYFDFFERQYWNRGFRRERCVDRNFQLTPEIRDRLRAWIKAPDWPNPESIRIEHGKTDVLISWRKATVPLFRTSSRMPPVAYDFEDNPIYDALRSKARQVKGGMPGTLRCIVLVDAGCDLLRRLHPQGAVHEIAGEKIIRYALTKLSIDSVVVLSPWRQRELGLAPRSTLLWKVGFFDRRNSIPDGEYDRWYDLAAQLPRPKFEAYQARDLHRLGAFAPNLRSGYLPTHVTRRGGGAMTIKISATLLHEYLAARIGPEEFRKQAFSNDQNVFERELMRGHAIRSARFESGGVDEDDDYVVLDLDFDWEGLAAKRRHGRSQQD